MNASFRTAFWAMCLGLTVPMVLFIGVELISPGSTARKRTLAAAESKDSLRTKLQAATARPAKARSPGSVDMPAKSPGAAQETLVRDAAATPQSEAAGGEPQVVLGPELEPEQAPNDLENGTDRRVPAVPAHTRPKVRILPEIEPLPAEGGRTSAAIEQRLAGIQSNLDKIGRTLDAQQRDQVLRDQVPREPPVDPVKQVAELLKQLQESRQHDQLAQLDAPPSRQPSDEHLAVDEPQNGSPPLPPDAANGTPPPETDAPDAERKPRPVARIYRPRYLTGSALQALVEPLLTPNLGKTGAADADSIEPGSVNSGTSSGNTTNALVVHDLPQVMRRIDQLITKLDVAPTQVALEAVVITLQLNATQPQGIDLRAFNAAGHQFAVSPVEAASRSQSNGGLTLTNGFGLKCGVLTGDPQALISALEAAAHVRSARAWQMTVVNRQPAVLMLNDPFGLAGSGNQSGGNQAAAGTILKVRPTVDRSGLVQLDVRRDIDHEGPGSGNSSAALTNQISLHAGQTAVVGGFFAEQTALQFYRRSGIGQLPVVGGMFLKQAEVVERCETIVLLTPHVIASAADADSQVVRRQTQPTAKADASSTIQASHAVPPQAPGSSDRPRTKPRQKP